MINIGIIGNINTSLTKPVLTEFIEQHNDYALNIITLTGTDKNKDIDLYLCEQIDSQIKHEILEDKCVIINSDDEKMAQALLNLSLCVLTCGLSYKDTVTASSIEDNICTFCLQRNIKTLKNKSIAPQEFIVRLKHEYTDIYPVLAIITTLLVCGVSKTAIEKFMF